MNQTATIQGHGAPEPTLTSDPICRWGSASTSLGVDGSLQELTLSVLISAVTYDREQTKNKIHRRERHERPWRAPHEASPEPLWSQPALPSWHLWVTLCTRVPKQESLSELVSRVLSGVSFCGHDWLMHYSNDSSVYGRTDTVRPKAPTTNPSAPLSADCHVWPSSQKTGYFPQLWRRWPPRN